MRCSGDSVIGFTIMPLSDRFDAIDFGRLLFDRQVLVDDANAAVLGHGNREGRLGDGIHCRALRQRHVQRDVPGRSRCHVDLARHDRRVSRHQQDIVEGQGSREVVMRSIAPSWSIDEALWWSTWGPYAAAPWHSCISSRSRRARVVSAHFRFVATHRCHRSVIAAHPWRGRHAAAGLTQEPERPIGPARQDTGPPARPSAR